MMAGVRSEAQVARRACGGLIPSASTCVAQSRLASNRVPGVSSRVSGSAGDWKPEWLEANRRNAHVTMLLLRSDDGVGRNRTNARAIGCTESAGNRPCVERRVPAGASVSSVAARTGRVSRFSRLAVCGALPDSGRVGASVRRPAVACSPGTARSGVRVACGRIVRRVRSERFSTTVDDTTTTITTCLSEASHSRRRRRSGRAHGSIPGRSIGIAMQLDQPQSATARVERAPSACREHQSIVEQAVEAALDDPGFSDLLYPLVDRGIITSVYEHRSNRNDEPRFVTVTLEESGRHAGAVFTIARRTGWAATDTTPSVQRVTFEPQANIH